MRTSKKKRKKLYILAASAVIIAALCIFAFDMSLNVVEYTVASDKLSDSFTAVLVSDLHSCSYGENQTELISAIERENPDVIFLVGDIVDDKVPEEDAFAFLSAISLRYPCYYVSGNHEFWSGRIDEIKDEIRNMGIRVLEGEAETLNIAGNTLIVCGADDPEAGEDVFSSQLISCAQSIGDDTFTILLSHRPERISDYALYGFDLVLSGHAHGGQVRIPFFIDGLYSPHQGFFPKYAGGMKEYGDTSIIISRGLAKESTKFPRIFNPPELVAIHFTAEN